MPVSPNVLILVPVTLLVLVAVLLLIPETAPYLVPLVTGAVALLLLRARSATTAKDSDA